MKAILSLKQCLAGLFLLILLVSCTATPTETSPIEPTNTTLPPTVIKKSTSCEEVEDICMDLTFDGENCTYDGPTEFGPGPVTLFFNNESDGIAAVNFLILLEGKTIDDVIEYNGEEPTTKHHPSWSQELGTWQMIASGDSQHWEGNLEPGDYFMVCVRFSPLGAWLGTGLSVK